MLCVINLSSEDVLSCIIICFVIFTKYADTIDEIHNGISSTYTMSNEKKNGDFEETSVTDTLVRESISVKAGARLTLRCPGAGLDVGVAWFNESILIG